MDFEPQSKNKLSVVVVLLLELQADSSCDVC